MKSTHKKLIEVHQQMGYEIDTIYPDLKTTIIRRGDKYKTIKGSIWKHGKFDPNKREA